MDITKIEANQNAVVFHQFAGNQASSTFTKNFHIPFSPDYILIKGINYSCGAGDANALI